MKQPAESTKQPAESTNFPRLARTSPLAERAYAAIKRMIISNELQPGRTITESQLALSLGISRSPVREAIGRLQDEGFLELEAWKPPRVSSLTPKFIRELYEVRTALESRAARESAPNIPSEAIEAMAKYLAALRAPLQHKQIDTFNRLEPAFHGLFIEYCNNDLLRSFLARLQDHLNRLRSVFAEPLALHKTEEFREHLLILDAMRQRDAKELERRVADHISNVAERLLKSLQDT